MSEKAFLMRTFHWLSISDAARIAEFLMAEVMLTRVAGVKINSPGLDRNMSQPAAETESKIDCPAIRWFFAQQGRKCGPVPLQELQKLVSDGLLKLSDLILPEGQPKWVPVSSVIVEPPANEVSLSVCRVDPIDGGSLEAGETAPLFQPQFFVDLREAYSDLRPPEDYVQSLAALFDYARGSVGRRWDAFQRELEELNLELERDKPETHIHKLQDLFLRVRSSTIAEAKELCAKLPATDPLFCPVGLFAPLRITRAEVPHTTVLAWLLKDAEHGFGHLLLEHLLMEIKGGFWWGSVKVRRVESEYAISLPDGRDGRIDVWAEGTWLGEDETPGAWTLLIEAKIDAQESPGQLSDYEEWMELTHRHAVPTRIFVTPDGREPTTNSQPWEVLDFLALAGTFRNVLGDLKEKPGYDFLRYYLAGIMKDLYRWKLPVQEATYTDDPYSVLDYLRPVKKGTTNAAR